MNKYISAHKIVMKLTEDEALRTFFTLYFMEDDDVKRDIIDAEFWAEVNLLPDSEKAIMKEKLRQTFRNFHSVVAEWGADVEHFIAQQSKIAA